MKKWKTRKLEIWKTRKPKQLENSKTKTKKLDNWKTWKLEKWKSRKLENWKSRQLLKNPLEHQAYRSDRWLQPTPIHSIPVVSSFLWETGVRPILILSYTSYISPSHHPPDVLFTIPRLVSFFLLDFLL